MDQFIDRHRELRELNALSKRKGAQFVIVYGRRRVGKTTLLLHWAQQTGRPYFFWVARRETSDMTRSRFAKTLWRWAYPNKELPEPSQGEDWEILFNLMARMIGDQPTIVIFDEFPFAVEADSSLPSHLQVLWDHQLKDKNATLVLSGSHVGMMQELLDYNAPLYGRFTAQLPVEPMPYTALAEFFPHYPADERVATYAILGGIPAYLEKFDPGQSLAANVREHLFQRTGMFQSEPTLMISELAHKTQTYEVILRAIADKNRTPSEISEATGLFSSSLGPYLKHVCTMGFVERRIPALIPPQQRRTTTQSRYYLSDPYLRFYFRFIEPNLELIEQGAIDILWEEIKSQLRAFIGETTFEEICREWVIGQLRTGKLPFLPRIIGSHWSKDVQVDVVAVNWKEKEKAVLLGECKWGADPVGRSVIRELIEDKTPKVLAELPDEGEGWQVHYAFFARAGFTDAARADAELVGAQLVDLEMLDKDLFDSLNAATG